MDKGLLWLKPHFETVDGRVLFYPRGPRGPAHVVAPAQYREIREAIGAQRALVGAAGIALAGVATLGATPLVMSFAGILLLSSLSYLAVTRSRLRLRDDGAAETTA